MIQPLLWRTELKRKSFSAGPAQCLLCSLSTAFAAGFFFCSSFQMLLSNFHFKERGRLVEGQFFRGAGIPLLSEESESLSFSFELQAESNGWRWWCALDGYDREKVNQEKARVRHRIPSLCHLRNNFFAASETLSPFFHMTGEYHEASHEEFSLWWDPAKNVCRQGWSDIIILAEGVGEGRRRVMNIFMMGSHEISGDWGRWTYLFFRTCLALLYVATPYGTRHFFSSGMTMMYISPWHFPALAALRICRQ